MRVYQGAWLGSEASEKKRVSRRKYMKFFISFLAIKKYMQFIISTIPGWDSGEGLTSTKIPVSDLTFYT